MTGKLSLRELIERLDTPGWVATEDDNDKLKSGTLKDALETTHQRRQRKQTPGLIQQIETKVELDMLQIEQLWHHLGLPTV